MEQWEYKQLAQRHIAQLKYMANVKDHKIEYNNIYTYEDYERALIGGLGGLGYPLRKEVKRDRFVLNSEGMRQTMEQATRIALDNMESEIYAFLQNKYKQMVARTTEEVLNTITYNGKSFKASAMSSSEKWAMKLGSMFGSKLASEIMYVFNDLMNGGNGKSKKKKKK